MLSEFTAALTNTPLMADVFVAILLQLRNTATVCLVGMGTVADLQQRTAKPSLGWPECRLPTPRDGWLAFAAKVRNPLIVLKNSSFAEHR